MFAEFTYVRRFNVGGRMDECVVRREVCRNEIRDTGLAIKDLLFTKQVLKQLLSTVGVVKEVVPDTPEEVQSARWVVGGGGGLSTSSRGPCCGYFCPPPPSLLQAPEVNEARCLSVQPESTPLFSVRAVDNSLCSYPALVDLNSKRSKTRCSD